MNVAYTSSIGTNGPEAESHRWGQEVLRDKILLFLVFLWDLLKMIVKPALSFNSAF